MLNNRSSCFFVPLFIAFLAFLSSACSKVEDALELLDDPERKTIDVSRLGTNAIVNDRRFGSIREQLTEVRSTLGLRFVRVLFSWNDSIQPTPTASPDFSFYDDIVAGLPAGVDALVVLTDLPSWMSSPANWSNGNPRGTFVERWVKPMAERYSSFPGVVGFQVWNEPNDTAKGANTTLGVVGNPEQYVELLMLAENSIRAAGNKLVVSAATTAMNQNYPETLDYNRGMRDAGAESAIDVWAMHYYGKQFENVLRDGGVADFFEGVSKPVWVTESGAQGVNAQLAYGEQVWPFLQDKIPQIARIYQYQFATAGAPESSYGLRTLSAEFPISDLYQHLQERAGG